MTEATLDSGLTATFTRAEQSGLRLAIKGRTFALGLIAIWFVVSRPFPQAMALLGLIVGFGLLGMAHYRLIGSPHDRWWWKYVFITIDIAVLAAAIALAPLSPSGEVPQVLAFRNSAFNYFYVVLAVAAFAISPWLVLWSGLAITISWWVAFGWVTSGIENAVTWWDMPPAPTAEEYFAVFLSPDFVGTGSRIQETLVLLVTAVILAIGVQRARGMVSAQARADQERELVTKTFGQYVPEAVAAALIEDRGVLAPKQQVATVLFLDIQGFTARAESMPPTQVIAMLNGFFEVVAEAITRHNGVIIQFIGDAVMATFNVPLEDTQHAARAVRAAQEIATLVGDRRFQGARLGVRIGLNTGPLAAGSVGGSGRQAYTVYGDTVNLAARLEAMNKDYGTWLLADHATVLAAGPDFAWLEIGEVAIRGKQQPAQLFTLADVNVSEDLRHGG